jgi:hypothetical protein
MDPDTEKKAKLIFVIALPVQVTPAQLQEDMIDDPLEHSHPEYPAEATCNALAMLHIDDETVTINK